MSFPASYWSNSKDAEHIICELCPRFCRLREGQRGLCFVRKRSNDELILDTYGRSAGFCIDPIEKNHSIISYLELLFLVLELLVVILLVNFVRTMTFQNVVTRMHWLITHPLFRLRKQRINTSAGQLLIPITIQ